MRTKSSRTTNVPECDVMKNDFERKWPDDCTGLTDPDQRGFSVPMEKTISDAVKAVDEVLRIH